MTQIQEELEKIRPDFYMGVLSDGEYCLREKYDPVRIEVYNAKVKEITALAATVPLAETIKEIKAILPNAQITRKTIKGKWNEEGRFLKKNSNKGDISGY